MQRIRKKTTVRIAAIALFSMLLILSLADVWFRYKADTNAIILNDIEQLARIFKKINDTAGILGFDHQKNWINFLTIKSGGFVGSEIGSMTLMHPELWEGPYVVRNPTIQGKEYQIVRTNKGHFIVPGTGVVLSNGHEIGKTIILDEQADIEVMLKNEALLGYQKKGLGDFLPIGAAAVLVKNSETECKKQ